MPQPTDLYIGETLNTSPPPFCFIWFVNTPQDMTNTIQVKRKRKVGIEKKFMQFCVCHLDSNLQPTKLRVWPDLCLSYRSHEVMYYL